MAENNIEKKIEAVVGETIEDAIKNEEPVEIEIVSEEVTVTDDPRDVLQEFSGNLAEEIDESELNIISSDLMGEYENDKSSREEWEKTYSQGLDLLGFKYNERTQPFQGASGVTHPLLAEAVTQFSSSAYKELMPASGPVRTYVVGDETPEKYQQSQRVKDFMNYQITNVMEEYTPELDQMLFYLPLSGSTFKKIYYDANLGRAVSKFIRMTENEVRKKQVSGFYRDIDLKTYDDNSQNSYAVKDKIDKLEGVEQVGEGMMMSLLEFHVNLDLIGYEDKQGEEKTGIKIPYIVTIDEESRNVLSIRRNFEEGDKLFKKTQYFVHFKFLQGLGFYGFGLIHLIGGLSRSATQALRQLLDAGTLSNLPAGFKARGLRIRDDDSPLQPGEFRDVDAPGGAIRDGLMPLPYKEPSQTLFALLGFVVQAGQRFAQIADMQVGDANQGAPVGTTIALLERGSRIMSSIHKRIYYSMKKEFKLLANVIKTYLPSDYPYQVVGGDRSIKVTDFDEAIDIIPVADPNMFSMAQRIQLAQTQLQMATSAPQLHNIKEAYRRMYEALGVSDIDKIMKLDKPEPMSPTMEHQRLLDQDKIEAYEGQNHDAHIQAHLLFGMSSVVQALPMIALDINKHIMQHISLKARETVDSQVMQAEEQMGEQAQNIDELKTSQIAQVEAQLLAALQQQQAQMSGQGQPDPVIQLKQQELQQRAMRDQKDAEYDFAKLNLDQAKLAQKEKTDQARIESAEDIAQLRANINLKKLDASQKRN